MEYIVSNSIAANGEWTSSPLVSNLTSLSYSLIPSLTSTRCAAYVYLHLCIPIVFAPARITISRSRRRSRRRVALFASRRREICNLSLTNFATRQ